jgi:hypothetical protein
MRVIVVQPKCFWVLKTRLSNTICERLLSSLKTKLVAQGAMLEEVKVGKS